MKICVIGVGNIGMRYVQGISKTFPHVQLFLVDSPVRLRELEKLNLGDVRLLTSVEDIQECIDLCIVATSSEPRLAIYKRCLELNPQYIILEKYLFRSREEFRECLSLVRVPTFVNQWLYGSNTFDPLFEGGASSVELIGSDWGLACNAVHWIDVFKRHMNMTDLQVGADTAVAKVFPSKRTGYEEIYGQLEFVDAASDKAFKLVDQGGDRFVGVQEIRVDDRVYRFDYIQVTRNGNVLSRFPYFSDQIGGITSQILDKGRCHLPLLEESISQHLLMEDILEGLDRRPNIT